MKANAKLTATQIAILKSATQRPNGDIDPLPDNLRGAARAQVIKGLLAKGLVCDSGGRYVLTDAGYAAVGKRRSTPRGVQKADAPDGVQNLDAIPRAIRPGTKVMTLVDLLKAPGGATIVTLLQATGWLPHTIRGAISAIVKKKLGFRVISEKGPDGERIYKIDITTPKAK